MKHALRDAKWIRMCRGIINDIVFLPSQMTEISNPLDVETAPLWHSYTVNKQSAANGRNPGENISTSR